MTADVRPFSEAAEGTGPAELDYRGPQGWATVVHRAHVGSFTLLGPEDTHLVREFEPGQSRTEEPRTWEYRVGLSGPQRLRIETAERWSVSVAPLEQDEPEDGGVFSHRGIGNQTVELAEPDPPEASILEFTRIESARPTSLFLRLRTDFGDEAFWPVGDDDRARFLFGHDTPAIWSSAGRVEVGNAVGCEWRLRVLPLSAARPLDGTTTRGTGAEVLVHTGVPASLTLSSPADTGDDPEEQVREVEVRVESHGYKVTLSTRNHFFEDGAVLGLGPGPTLLQTGSGGGWELRTTALDAVRTFDGEFTGTGGKVLRYTGPPVTARIVTRSWHRWSGMVSVRTLTPELRWRDWVNTKGGLPGRLRGERLDLLPGMLLAVTGPHDGSAWHILRTGQVRRAGLGRRQSR
ncbi:hypothetical protein [Streptomyces sp. MBT62]|uniref:hypothetical protein n=1 Tax=Streptomyces sp. MBT62 TaxID=2800410 RepID=UPI00190A11C5|nr:hypothetical protein [Streptomyces sp. MBT62]MBK3566955.1 hypothetical protein [Streptomyces sp. MBT62]